MAASVIPFRAPGDPPPADPDGGPAGDVAAVAARALDTAHRHLDRCALAASTVEAYRRQTAAYAAWLAEHAARHPDAFADIVGAEAAVTAWRRHLIQGRAKPPTVNQALAAVTLLYGLSGLRITVKRARVPRPGEPPTRSPPLSRVR